MKFSRLLEATVIGSAPWAKDKDVPIYQMSLEEVRERSNAIKTGDFVKGIALKDGTFLIFGDPQLEHEEAVIALKKNKSYNPADGAFAFYLYRRYAYGPEWIVSVDTPSNVLPSWRIVDPLPGDEWSEWFEKIIIKSFPFAEWIQFDHRLVKVNPRRNLRIPGLEPKKEDYEKLMGYAEK